MAPRNETIDDKYALVRELGSASGSTVYEAEQLLDGKRVTLKVLHRSLANDSALGARFVSEARAAAQIRHPNVADLQDLGVTADGMPYLVMELLEGESLQQLIARCGALPPADACELMVQILAGLGAAHELGIVHRDLKPASIVVTYPRPEAPLVKVLDFGLAKSGGAPGTNEGIIGTPLYMAPELALGREVDERADLYSAGVILYEMLAGEPPFDVTGTNLLANVIAGKWKPLASVNPAVPRLLALAIGNAMTTDPDQRVGSAHDFARHLGPYLSAPPDGPRGDAFVQMGSVAPDILGMSELPSRPPRDFPSLQLARVAGKPKGEPLADAILQSPIIPRAPVAPKIQTFGSRRDLERWSNAPAAQPVDLTSSNPPSTDILFRSSPPSRTRSLPAPPIPWRRAALAAALGVGLGLVFAWLYHLV